MQTQKLHKTELKRYFEVLNKIVRVDLRKSKNSSFFSFQKIRLMSM